HRADRARRRPGPLVHGPGGQGLRLRGPRDQQRRRSRGRRWRMSAGRSPLALRSKEQTAMQPQWSIGGTTPRTPRRTSYGKGMVSDMQSRYVLPSFVERTSYGVKEMNPYNKLFEERIIFLGVQIDDASANDVMAQLLTLEAIDPDREITMYINSPGGSMTSMM